MTTEKNKIFISHGAEEKELAIFLKHFLQKELINAFDVFVSSDDEDIPLGNEWLPSIKQALDKASILIVLCSPVSVVKPWINFEAGGGWMKAIPVIPLCHSGLTIGNLTFPLKQFQAGIIQDKTSVNNLLKLIASTSEFKVPNKSHKGFIEKFKYLERLHTSSFEIVKELHHINLPVKDLEVSKSFYKRVFGLREVERPDFGFDGAWFHLPTGQQLHLVLKQNTFYREKTLNKTDYNPPDIHFAWLVSLEDFNHIHATALREKIICEFQPYIDRTRLQQLYLLDPDNHIIEILHLLPEQRIPKYLKLKVSNKNSTIKNT